MSLVLSHCNQKTLAWVHSQQHSENRINLTANFLRGTKSILNPSLDRSIDEICTMLLKINRLMHYRDIYWIHILNLGHFFVIFNSIFAASTAQFLTISGRHTQKKDGVIYRQGLQVSIFRWSAHADNHVCSGTNGTSFSVPKTAAFVAHFNKRFLF